MPWGEILLGTVLGAVVLFVWYAVAWMALKHHNKDFRAFPDPEAMEQVLDAGSFEPGVYYTLPHWAQFEEGMKDPAMEERYQRGPNAWLVAQPAGPAFEGRIFAQGFLVDVFYALGCALFFHAVGGFNANLPATILFFALLGFFVSFGPLAAQSVWMKMPWSHTLKSALDGVVGFALVGVVLHFVMG